MRLTLLRYLAILWMLFPVGVRGGWPQSISSPAQLGPVHPEDIKLPPNPVTRWTAERNLRFFGWMNGGYTGSSTGQGLLNVEPRANRFGDAWLLNQAAVVFEQVPSSEGWSWGFRSEFYMGADAALLRPLDGFGPTNPRFGTDFRQAYVSVHAPILTDRGVELKLGRQYTPLGYETTMAAYRPMYSEAYSWIYSQNGATTGAIATIHVNPKLDVITGPTLGVNSLFNFRGRAPCYIARGFYRPDTTDNTRLIGTVYTGPEPIAAAAGHVGKWQTEVETQFVRHVNRRLGVVSETNFGWDTRDPAHNNKTSSWVGTYEMAIIHAHRLLDVNTRAEWFHDIDGSRTGHRANYSEMTGGINFMPKASVNFRPEVRWDGADSNVFGPAGKPPYQNHQWTYAFETLLKF
jgi:hypothetical protein